MSKCIQVFSPHFDDAALCVGQHILDWRKAGYVVEVFTIFTEFESSDLSLDARDLIQQSKAQTVQEYAKQRAHEDKLAMKQLGVSAFRSLGYGDGGFRRDENGPVYESFEQLFQGRVLDDRAWIARLRRGMVDLIKSDAEILTPLGVGLHADHLIVRNILKEIVPREKLSFYLDIPYAFELQNWTVAEIRALLTNRSSKKWSSRAKLKALKSYSSQLPILFSTGMWEYPEIIIGGHFVDI